MGGAVLVKMTYLSERSNGYYAELYVPPRLRPIVGRQVFRENLRTRDEGTALRLRDAAMARLRAKLAAMVEQAQNSHPHAANTADWMAVQVAKHREKAAELERQAASERSLVAWAIEQIRLLKPDHPAAAAGRVPSFAEAARQLIEVKRSTWRSDEWTWTFRRHVFPRLGNLPVNEVSTDSVLAVLQPIWGSRTETAKKIRLRIEAVLDYAK